MYFRFRPRDAVTAWPISRLVRALACQRSPCAWWCSRDNGYPNGYVDPLGYCSL